MKQVQAHHFIIMFHILWDWRCQGQICRSKFNARNSFLKLVCRHPPSVHIYRYWSLWTGKSFVTKSKQRKACGTWHLNITPSVRVGLCIDGQTTIVCQLATLGPISPLIIHEMKTNCPFCHLCGALPPNLNMNEHVPGLVYRDGDSNERRDLEKTSGRISVYFLQNMEIWQLADLDM